MSLPNGMRLGPYEILALLGAGGMEGLYGAQDTRLECTVAIKVLPAHPSSNADARQCFEREACAVSSQTKELKGNMPFEYFDYAGIFPRHPVGFTRECSIHCTSNIFFIPFINTPSTSGATSEASALVS
jgi:hypothetical protein